LFLRKKIETIRQRGDSVVKVREKWGFKGLLNMKEEWRLGRGEKSEIQRRRGIELEQMEGLRIADCGFRISDCGMGNED
jgi:hypothetical protein